MKRSVFAIIALVVAASVLQPASAQTLKVLHQFNFRKQGEGSVPHAALLRDAAGNLYGTTLDGGSGDGTVFKVDSTGKETVLLAFDPSATGSSPDSPVIQDQSGNLYGIAPEGGPGGGGVVYKLSPQGEVTVLYAFQLAGKHNPIIPTGGLFMDELGNIFGTTFHGGNGDCPSGCGTIFRLDPAGKLHVLHKFTGLDGSEPFGPLVQDKNGNLYGVAHSGGDLSCPDPEIAGNGCGTVYKLAKNGALTVLHTFEGRRDGSTPQGGLALDPAGNIYGVAGAGGNFEHGTAFKISRKGDYSILHRFARGEGTNPNGGLVLDKAGNLYGTALFNGGHNLGSVFELSPFGQLTDLHRFRGRADGGVPSGGLIRDAAGNLYGTTIQNVSDERFRGNVFEISF